MKSNTRSIASSLIGSKDRVEEMLFTPHSDEKIELYREGLSEWLVTFGMRWVAWHEVCDMIALGYPQREGYLERKTAEHHRDIPYLHFRLTQKGLEFINETR
jgi:hypothetical protein